MAIIFDTKVFISGNVIEVYQYSEHRAKGYTRKQTVSTAVSRNEKVIDFETGEIVEEVDMRERDRLESRMKSNIRARNEVKRLVLTNFDKRSKFMTLTFRENLKDIEEANRCFKTFIKYVNRVLNKKGKPNIKYVAVVEFQKRGAIHYHMICDLMGFSSKKLWELWKGATGKHDGGVDIKNIRQVDNVGAYITKYMVKDLEKVDDRLIGKKVYQRSQGLEKPKQLVLNLSKEKDKKIFDLFMKGKKITYQSDYEDKHTGGTVTYQEINLSRQGKK